jgi:hypothetical protein
VTGRRSFWAHPRIRENSSLFEHVFNQVKAACGREILAMTDYSERVPLKRRTILFTEEAAALNAFVYAGAPTQTYGEVLAGCVDRIITEVLRQQKCLALWWSGGIDSTALVIGFLTHPRWREVRAFTVIKCTQDSIAEYPKFFRDCIEGPCLHDEQSKFSDYHDPRYLNVDGCFGDEIFGTSVPEYLHALGVTDVDTSRWPVERVPDVVTAVTHSEPVAEWFFQQSRKIAERFPVTNVWQFFWMLELMLCHQDVMLRPYFRTVAGAHRSASMLHDTFEAHRRIRVFGGAEFLTWGLAHGFSGGWQDGDRDAAKRYIHEFTRDDEYLLTKGKVYSQGLIYEDSAVNAIYDDWTTDVSFVGRL